MCYSNVNQVVSLWWWPPGYYCEAGTRLEKVCVYEHTESSLLLCISLHGPFRKLPWMISYDYHLCLGVVRSQVEYKKKGANGQNMHPNLNPCINAFTALLSALIGVPFPTTQRLFLAQMLLVLREGRPPLKTREGRTLWLLFT